MISVEICYSESGGERFDDAEDLAAAYIAYLLKQYDWDIDKVYKHQDFSGKYCPHRTLDIGWERFLDKIRYHLGEQNQPAPEEKNEGGDLEMARVYQNGKTPEPVFADTGLTKKIGSYYYAYCPKGFIIDYEDSDLLKRFTNNLKKYYKKYYKNN